MLRLSKMADYAGVIIVHIARASGRVHTAAGLSEELKLPKATVAKCLKIMTKDLILTSTRGVKGGYILARPANEISVAQVIDALEGPLELTSCVHGKTGDCQIEKSCPMRGGWDAINGTIYNVLKDLTIADMAK